MELEFLYGIASAEPYPIMTDFTVDCVTETPFQPLWSLLFVLGSLPGQKTFRRLQTAKKMIC